MANVKKDDCLLVGRGGVDYKVTYAELVDSIDLAPAGINEVLAEGNTAEALQSMRFRLGAESVPDLDSLNPDPILLEDGIGSAHRALASSWTSHVEGTGGLHSDVNCNYFANYVLDEDAAPTAMAKLSANLGFYLYQASEGPDGRESWGISINEAGIDVNDQFKVDLEGSVTAKEFLTVEIKSFPEQDKGVEINEGGVKLHKGVGAWTETTGYPQHIGIHHTEGQHPSFFIDDFGNCHLSFLYVGFYNTRMIGKDYPSQWHTGMAPRPAGIGLQGGMGENFVQIGAAGLTGQTEDIISIQKTEGNPAKAFTVSPAGAVTATEFIGDGSKLTNLPIPDPFPEAPTDGNVYVRNGQSKSWIRGLPYDLRTLPELP